MKRKKEQSNKVCTPDRKYRYIPSSTDRLEERFIDMTCHELRNPLSAIMQYSELILDILDECENSGLEDHPVDMDTDTITEACNTIILCTTHQRRIIDDILVTSKLDSGLVRVDPVSIVLVRPRHLLTFL